MPAHLAPPPAPIQPRIGGSFLRQTMMHAIGATMMQAENGVAVIRAPIGADFRQQHGAGHAGLAFTLGDSAAGFAALSLMPEGAEVMTVEIKINLLAPAIGDLLEARGEVVRAGRRLSVVRAEVHAVTGDTRKTVALLQGTMIPVDPA